MAREQMEQKLTERGRSFTCCLTLLVDENGMLIIVVITQHYIFVRTIQTVYLKRKNLKILPSYAPQNNK